MSFLILRKNGLGKGYLKQIAQKLSNTNVAKTVRRAMRLPIPSHVVRWGNLDNLPDTFANSQIINKPEAIRKISNKALFRMGMQEAGISVPQTTTDIHTLAHWVNDDHTVKAILRPFYHAAGEDFHVVTHQNDVDVLNLFRNRLEGNRGWYASKYIKKDREFRIFIVGGRVVCVCEKFVEDKDQVAWNNAQGGHFENVKFSDWPIKACIEAVKAFNLSELDFGAVDVIQQGDQPYVLEINSAPTITSEYRQSCFAKALSWLLGGQETPAVFPDRVKGWRRLVHPAISEECRRD